MVLRGGGAVGGGRLLEHRRLGLVVVRVVGGRFLWLFHPRCGDLGLNLEHLLPRPVLVVRVLLQVQLPESLRLVDEGLPLLVGEGLPTTSQPLGDLSIVHVGLLFADLPPFDLRPHHERVHRPLDVIWVVLLGLSSIRVWRRAVSIHKLAAEHW